VRTDTADVGSVDPQDDRAFAAWYAVVAACDRPGEVDWSAEELRQLALRHRPGSDAPEHVTLVAVRDEAGRTVGAGRLDLAQRDNRHLAFLDVRVHPEARRRGVGRALLGDLERRSAAAGRRVLCVEVDEAPAEVGASAGRAFAERSGFRCALDEVRRDLALPPDEARLAALEQAATPYAAGYRLHLWHDRCPDALAEQRAELSRSMSTEVPIGDLELAEEDWDVARLRHHEGTVVAQHRTALTVAAEHAASGRLVAYTEVHVSRSRPERAFQWDTLVLPEHRGHRLGTLVKVRCLRELVAVSPGTRLISTWNAADNAPMVAVNDALGFVPNGRTTEWQRPLHVASDQAGPRPPSAASGRPEPRPPGVASGRAETR
jgi:GNAT superfamily N-acetyltransferase